MTNIDENLIEAVRAGDVAEVEHLLSSGANPDAEDKNAWTALGMAVTRGFLPIVTALVIGGADVNRKYSTGHTPLEAAIVGCSLSVDRTTIVDVLLENGANPNAKAKNGCPLLLLPAFTGDLAAVEALLQYNVNISAVDSQGHNALMVASSNGHINIVNALKNTQLDKIHMNPPSQVSFDLVDAAISNSTSRIDLLIRQGVSPNSVDETGVSALGWAAYKGNLAAVKTLLEHNADPNFRDKDGQTPLADAVSQEKYSVAVYLLDKGADPYSEDNHGWTPLSWAARDNQVQILDAFLRAGIDPNKRDGMGSTPLEHAVEEGHVEAVEILLTHAADSLLEDSDGMTALDTAVGNKQHQIIKLIKKYNPEAYGETVSSTKKSPPASVKPPSQQDIANPGRAASKTQEDSTSVSLIADLNKLIGLSRVKAEVTQLINFLKFQQMRKAKGLSAPQQSLHMVFTGNPGTGKTTIARLIAQIYKSLGILSKGQFIETDRAGLVGGYLGQTAIKTQETVESAIGGVLFIDEAYSLTDNTHGHDQYGQEAVATLLKLMEDHRDDLIVIVAGYTEPMQKFIRSNPGLQSRFNKFLHFDDYAPAELTEIFRHFAASGDYQLHPATELKLTNVFAALYAGRDETFGNARLARNLFEKAINAHANRMVSAGAVDEASLVTLYPEDIPNA